MEEMRRFGGAVAVTLTPRGLCRARKMPEFRYDGTRESSVTEVQSLAPHFIRSATKQTVLAWMAAALLMFPSTTVADGMVFDRSAFEPLKPHEQRAIIYHQDGFQSMLIGLDLRRTNAVWMFPVPGRPDQVKVDVADDLPWLMGGYDLRRLAKRQRHKDFLWLPLITQVPLMPLWGTYYLSYKHGHGPGVTKHLEVDRFGIHAEVISATSVEELEAYLTSHGLPVKTERPASFKDYLTDNYVLVVGWISSRYELSRSLRQRREGSPEANPCLLLRFPANQAYYPLKATAGYGNSVIPVTLQILGLKTVDYPPLTRSVAVHPAKQEDDSCAVYYLRGSVFVEEGQKEASTHAPTLAIADEKKGPLEELIQRLSTGPTYYTLVTIKSRADLFSEDLWVSNHTPEDVRRAVAFLESPPHVLLLALWIAGLSVMAGALSGLVLFRRPFPYSIIGLFNLLSLLGLAIAVMIYRKKKGEAPKTIRFLVVYTIVFHVLVFVGFGALPAL